MKKVVVLSMVMMLMGFVSIAGAVPAVPDFVIVTTIDAFDAENIRYNGTKAIVENFNDAKINTPGLSITEFGGAGTFTLGYYENIVNNTQNRYQEFTYAPTLHGFGGWFDLANPGGPGGGIEVYVGAALVGTIPNTLNGQFWGFYSNIGPFSTVTFKDADISASVQETYQVVDLALCSAAPIPGSVLLMGTGILGLVGVGIRRKL